MVKKHNGSPRCAQAKLLPKQKPVSSIRSNVMSVSEKIPVREKIGYSLGDAASHIVFDSSVAILAYY